jgi:hypothetical protein
MDEPEIYSRLQRIEVVFDEGSNRMTEFNPRNTENQPAPEIVYKAF